MGFLFFATLAFAVLGVYGLFVSFTHMFPFSLSSLLWILLAVISFLPIAAFVNLYIDMFHPNLAAKSKESSAMAQTLVVHPDAGELQPLTAMGSETAHKLVTTIRDVELDSKAPHAEVAESEESLKAFAVKTNTNEFYLVNIAEHVELWKADGSKEKFNFGGSDDAMYFVQSISAVTESKLMVAVQIYDPRPSFSIYMLDANDFTSHLVAEKVAASNNLEYFEVKPIGEQAGLVLFYSDQVRAAPEIYYNYLNHILLVSTKYPNGAELLRLGIDHGNISEWLVSGTSVQIKTTDPRKEAPKESQWSIDISKMN